MDSFQRRDNISGLDPDYEYALSDDIIHIPKFHWVSVPRSLEKPVPDDTPVGLEIGRRGLLKNAVLGGASSETPNI